MLIKNYKRSDLIDGSNLYQLNEILSESIYTNMLRIKYFHNINPDEDVFLDIRCNVHEAKLNFDMFNFNETNMTYKYPAITNTVYIIIDECPLCEKSYEFELKVGDTINLGVCPYYNDAAIKIQKKWRLIKKFPTLWKIAEYYTAKKYAPENIIDKIDLS